MKKVLTLFFIMILALNVKAQTSLTEAVDFQSIDDYGRDIHLFDILDRGQHVALYFFFSDAETSPYFDPNIAEAYHHFGDNQEDVYFIGVAPSDDSLTIANWRLEYGVDFPVINRITVGDDAHEVCEDYGVIIFSTFVLIAPDRRILIDNIWPIMDAQELIDEIKENMDTEDIICLNENRFKIYPNPATTYFNININGEALVDIYDMTGRCVKQATVNDNSTINVEDLEKGVYFVKVADSIKKLVVK